MKKIALTAGLLGAISLAFATRPVEPAPSTPAVAPFHCQVPCGIYGDKMRIEMLMEDATTIEKAMGEITKMEKADSFAYNQMVRWVVNKEEHAQNIQDQVAAYWMAQRVKAPREDTAENMKKYHTQLRTLHAVTVAAMKCKQTTDKANVEALRAAANRFAATYFSKEDLQHLREHR